MAKTLSIIVAVAEDHGIGYKNELLTYISEDLKRFKRITKGHPVIMGRNTWESLPKKPLPGRKNIVLTSQALSFEGATVVNSVEEAISECPEGEEVFIMGGAKVYEQLLAKADRLYLTKIHKSFEADTYFPEINEEEWEILEEEHITNDEQAGLEYSFINMKRK